MTNRPTRWFYYTEIEQGKLDECGAAEQGPAAEGRDDQFHRRSPLQVHIASWVR